MVPLHTRALWISAMLALGVLASSALAFGPGTHVREAETYLDGLAEGLPPAAAAADRALLEDPDTLPFFLMGAIFPDVGRRVADIGFEPHRLDLLEALLDATAGPAPADGPLRAFVLGNALHASSDAAAQVFLVSYLTAATDIGVVDVLIDAYDGPGGENEFFVEAVADLYVGDLHAVVDLYYSLTPRAEEPVDLRPVLVDYYTLAGDFLGPLPVDPETFADHVFVLLDQVGDLIGGLSPETAHAIVEGLITSPPDQLFDLLTGSGSAILGIGGIELQPDDVDRQARLQLMTHPFVADREVYSVYSDWFGRLGSAFLRDFFAGRTLFHDWDTWRGPPLLAADLQSLAWRLPETLAPDPTLLVWSLQFAAGDGEPLTELDGSGLPEEVRARLEVFPSTQAAVSLVAEVRGDRPGLDWRNDPVVGSATLELDGLPETGGPPHRAAIDVAFDPSDTLDDVLGYYLVARTEAGGEDRPTLVTQPEPYLAAAGADLTLPAWEAVFQPFDGWQPYLPIAEPTAVLDGMVLDIRVRNARFLRQGVAQARVELWRDGIQQGAAVMGSTGRLVTLSPLPGGSWQLRRGSAAGFAWIADGAAVPVASGETAILSVTMDPVPVVVDLGDFSPSATQVRGQVDDLRFAASQRFEAAVAREPVAPAAGFVEVGAHFGLDVQPPAADGDALYLFARAPALPPTPAGPLGMSDGIVVDTAPPDPPSLTVAERWPAEADSLAVGLEGADPHSGLAAYHVSLAGRDGAALLDEELPGQSPQSLELAWDAAFEGQSELAVTAVAINGAGLSSEPSTARVAIEARGSAEGAGEASSDAGPTGDAGDPVGQADADAQAAGAGGGTEDGCGCDMAGTPADDLWLMGLGLVLWVWPAARPRSSRPSAILPRPSPPSRPVAQMTRALSPASRARRRENAAASRCLDPFPAEWAEGLDRSSLRWY